MLLAAACGTAVAACGNPADDVDESEVTGENGAPDESDGTDESGETGDAGELRQFVSLERFEQQIPPDDAAVIGKTTGVIVPENVEAVWPTWGPVQLPALDPPDITGQQVVVIWDAGHSLEVTGYQIDDTGLVVHGVRHLPGLNCVTTSDIGGATIVGSVNDHDVQPGMHVGEPVIERQVTDCE